MNKPREPKKKTLFLIDGSSVIYRAFHAIPKTLSTSRGLPTNAVYGFAQTLKKILKEYVPDYIGVAFDVKGPSFRHELYEKYKAERPPMPDTLAEQMPYIKKLVMALNIPALEKETFEADDVIATIVQKVEKEGMDLKVVLITGDKDMHQLVDSTTVVLDYLKDRETGVKEVEKKFGVGPTRIRDLLALAGDTSDNIPGVPGIGLKTAAKLLGEFETLEGVYEAVDSVRGKKLKENLLEHKDRAFLSRELATLHKDVPLDLDLADLELAPPDTEALVEVLNELEFSKFLKDFTGGAGEGGGGRKAPEVESAASPGELSELSGELAGVERFSVTVAATGCGPDVEPTSATLATGPDRAFFVPIGEDALAEKEAFTALKGPLEDESVKKDTDDYKTLYAVCLRNGVELRGVDVDTALASYLVNPSRAEHTVEALVLEYLGHPPAEVEAPAEDRFGQKACDILSLAEVLKEKLEGDGLLGLYREMELPLAGILAGMELAGIRLDVEKLEALSGEMELKLRDMEERIYRSAGEEFNINSPKQLSRILFEKLGLKPIKRTKTGFSTNEEVLTKLAASHEVPRLIIGYRQTAKLKSTYVDALQGLVSPSTGRVHTSFNQTVTATGRLSSSNPNLQNIPIRGEVAGRIREAFVADPGCVFLSADYSQIELRIVAHLSEDPSLLEAFQKGEDVHTRTASEVFDVAPDEVTPEMRRRAKAINFGIIYGMGPYGLAGNLGISVGEASEYIASYFAHYVKVKEFIDGTIELARERGYTTTIFGRRRYIPELESPVESSVRFGQRLAINTPVQGSAADIIKAAMIRVHSALEEDFGEGTRMLLQIHDELLFEAPSRELERLREVATREMEGVMKLKVPVKVNVKTGMNWRMVD